MPQTARPRGAALHRWLLLFLALAVSGYAATLPEPTHPVALAPPTFAAGDPASWAFTPAHDDFSPEALFDLRSLNERVAGEHGFVRVSPEGDFLRGDGAPLRFWAVNFEPRVHLDDDQFAYAARFLAKRGVNMVRWHGFLNPKVPGSNAFQQPPLAADDPLPAGVTVPPLDRLDRTQLDDCWRLVAAMRRAGIYLTLSPYWAVNFKHAHRWGLPAGVGPDRDAQGLLFFEPRLQAAYRQWLRDWLLTPNPYTGIPLAQDPAVAVISFQNEDSLLFWTVDFLAPGARRLLVKKFGAWLAQKHGSLAKTREAWGAGAADAADDWNDGAPALLKLDAYVKGPAPARAVRLADQLEFYATTMRDFNAETARYLREELGVRAVLNAGNWRTASGDRLNDAERWSYLPAEAIAVNRYYTSPHSGKDRGWTVQVGHRFGSVSALRRADNIPAALRQIEGRPMLVTEGTWVMPTKYRAEGPLTMAAYQSLTGVDAFYWFSMNYADWTQPTLVDGFYRGAFKWTSQTPDVLGLFPGAALLFRRGDVKRSPPVLRETRLLSDVWAAKPPALNEEPGYDPNRDPGRWNPAAGSGNIPSLAYLVGPVQVAYTTDPAKAKVSVADLKPWLDPRQGIVRSDTGEITLNYHRGLLQVDAPRAQGIAGFFPDGEHRVATSDIAFTVANDYAQVLAVALDDAPLRESKKVLVQLGTIIRPTGWQTKPAMLRRRGSDTGTEGEEVTALGGAPWRIEKFSGSLSVRNPGLTRATVCDANGLPVGEAPVQRNGDWFTITLPAAALYVVLRQD
jgi:hypothetical protein